MESPLSIDHRNPSTARIIGQSVLSGIVISAAGRAFNSAWDFTADLISRRKKRRAKKATA